jgi:hypothetical protein
MIRGEKAKQGYPTERTPAELKLGRRGNVKEVGFNNFLRKTEVERSEKSQK